LEAVCGDQLLVQASRLVIKMKQNRINKQANPGSARYTFEETSRSNAEYRNQDKTFLSFKVQVRDVIINNCCTGT